MRVIVTKEGHYFVVERATNDDLLRAGQVLLRLRERGQGHIERCGSCGGA